MKKLLFLFILGLLMFSCTKENANDPMIEIADIADIADIAKSAPLVDRLMFSNFREALDLYVELSKMDPNELLLWARTKKHSTLLYSQDTTIMNYSNALKTILNKDYEFQVGDSIIRLNNGSFFAFSKFESKEPDFDKLKKVGSVEYCKEQSSNKGSVTLYAGQRDATCQKEFNITQYIPCYGNPEYGIFGYRKYVSELYHEFLYLGYYPPFYTFQSSIYLRIKLEYRTSHSNWYICHNEHVINYHVYGTAEFTMYYGSWETYNFNLYRSYGGCDDIVTIPLNVLLHTRPGVCDGTTMGARWRVTIEGTITQQINGDPHPYTFVDNKVPWWGI